jgi:hypothetical protein
MSSSLHPKPKISYESIMCILLGGLITCLIVTILLLPEIFVRESRDSSIFYLRNPSINKLASISSTLQAPRPKFILPISEIKTITCSDGSHGLLNDDYCDCSDGSDELLTSACSHILVGQHIFECDLNKKSIYASRISDGIYDCKDQADE